MKLESRLLCRKQYPLWEPSAQSDLCFQRKNISFGCLSPLITSSPNIQSTFQKEIYWVVRVCLYRRKFDSSKDLKFEFDFFPIQHFLDVNSSNTFWEFSENQIPVFTVTSNKQSQHLNSKMNEFARVWSNGK